MGALVLAELRYLGLYVCPRSSFRVVGPME